MVPGLPKCSSCCRTGSGSRESKVSPTSSSSGSRFARATPAAGTVLRAPGPIDVVTAITWRRRADLAKPTAASAIADSFWPRMVRMPSRCRSSASPRLSALPWPKMAKTPGTRAMTSPDRSSRTCWAMRKRTIASAVVSRTVVIPASLAVRAQPRSPPTPIGDRRPMSRWRRAPGRSPRRRRSLARRRARRRSCGGSPRPRSPWCRRSSS